VICYLRGIIYHISAKDVVLHFFVIYADHVNILGGSIHTVKKNTEALVVASKETGLDVSAEETV
jgi:hypothetical protein